MDEFKDYKKIIGSFLGDENLLEFKKKRTNPLEKKSEVLSKHIDEIQNLLLNGIKLNEDFGINLSEYESRYWGIISELFILSYGENIFMLTMEVCFGTINETPSDLTKEHIIEEFLKNKQNNKNQKNKL